MIEKGMIVRVVNPDLDLHGVQGEVVGTHDDGNEDGPVEVKFSHRHMRAFMSDIRTIRFQVSELHVESEWDSDEQAARLFPRMPPHSTYSLGYPFKPGMPCMIEGCDANATARGMYNYWGSACQADLCEEHFVKWNGKLVENFPMKQNYPYSKGVRTA